MAHATGTAPTDALTALWRVVRAFRARHADGPLDGPSVSVLHAVSERAPVRVSDVAADLSLDASTVSRHLRALQERGYLTRSADPADGRAALVALSAQGAAELDDALARRRASFEAAVEHWDPADRLALTRLLARLADDLAAPQETP